ncbi:IclR family transcriptional regulator [Humibacter ginsengiterrae]
MTDTGTPTPAATALATAATTAPASQTLSRGIRILEELADARVPLTVDELARRLGVHRSIAYRLLRTLDDHGLVMRETDGRYALGARLAALAMAAVPDLQAASVPELNAAADDLGMTCFLAVLDHEECVTLASVEPRHAVASVAQRPGARHPVWAGAPGKALLSIMQESEWPTAVPPHVAQDVAEARERGWATSHDEVIPTLKSVSVPLRLRGRRRAAIAVVYVGEATAPERIARRLRDAADAIRDALGE